MDVLLFAPWIATLCVFLLWRQSERHLKRAHERETEWAKDCLRLTQMNTLLQGQLDASASADRREG